MSRVERRLLRRLLPALAVVLAPPAIGADPDAADLLAKSRAAYAAMTGYSDTGTVVTHYEVPGAPALVDRYVFSTAYRPPRQFLIDFHVDGDLATHRFVVWSDGGDFNTWWSDTGVHDDYPPGSGAAAFAVSADPTKGASVQIAPLLFSQAGLHGTLADFVPDRYDGSEMIEGHKTFRLVGTVGLAYSTGAVTGTRPTTIWIDADDYLVRRVFEDTVPDMAKGTVDQTTTTFVPVANPALDDAAFEFTVPSSP